jgi:hypothetical protein
MSYRQPQLGWSGRHPYLPRASFLCPRTSAHYKRGYGGKNGHSKQKTPRTVRRRNGLSTYFGAVVLDVWWGGHANFLRCLHHFAQGYGCCLSNLCHCDYWSYRCPFHRHQIFKGRKDERRAGIDERLAPIFSAPSDIRRIIINCCKNPRSVDLFLNWPCGHIRSANRLPHLVQEWIICTKFPPNRSWPRS